MESLEQKISGLVEKYSDRIFRLAFSYMKNRPDAEDAVQDVFVKLMEHNMDFNDTDHEKAWLIRVTINVCKNKLKQFWKRNTSGLFEVEEVSCEDEYISDNFILQAVMHLQEQYREVIHLYYYEGYSTPQIADLIGKHETNIRLMLHRARKKLKEILKEEYDFE